MKKKPHMVPVNLRMSKRLKKWLDKERALRELTWTQLLQELALAYIAGKEGACTKWPLD